LPTVTPLSTTLTAAVGHLDSAFRVAHNRLWAAEHLDRIADRLANWHSRGVPAGPPPPHFAAECTPHYEGAFAPFRGPLGDGSGPEAFARAMEAAGCGSLLLLLGQRRTPATPIDARGIPPTAAELIASAAARHHPRDDLTVAARALAKHSHRTPDRFWGASTGPAAVQNAHALEVLNRIVAGRTWWNVFGHYQHEAVFEARLPSGHGARWTADGGTFVGFLDSFDDGANCTNLSNAGGRG
jgi:hypothetical protein